jgi:hypothetical protein
MTPLEDYRVNEAQMQGWIGLGWVPIAVQLDEVILWMLAEGGTYEVLQVKEKFGTFRYYFTLSDDVSETVSSRVYGAVRMAEAIAAITCTECGNRGTMKDVFGGRVLCDTCETPTREEWENRWN